MKRRDGFTLIEIIMVIVVLGILAAVAIPKYYDIQSDAKTAAEKGAVGGVRSGIHTYFISNKTWPSSLDSATTGACNSTNACFTTILSQGGIISDWNKSSSTVYVGPTGANYTYTSSTGEFK